MTWIPTTASEGAMLEIAARIDKNDVSLHEAPVRTPVGRLDEVHAARALDCACL